jgi:hypothetical protein
MMLSLEAMARNEQPTVPLRCASNTQSSQPFFKQFLVPSFATKDRKGQIFFTAILSYPPFFILRDLTPRFHSIRTGNCVNPSKGKPAEGMAAQEITIIPPFQPPREPWDKILILDPCSPVKPAAVLICIAPPSPGGICGPKRDPRQGGSATNHLPKGDLRQFPQGGSARKQETGDCIPPRGIFDLILSYQRCSPPQGGSSTRGIVDKLAPRGGSSTDPTRGIPSFLSSLSKRSDRSRI